MGGERLDVPRGEHRGERAEVVRQLAPSAADAWSAAEIVEAAVRSDRARACEAVGRVEGPTTYDL